MINFKLLTIPVIYAFSLFLSFSLFNATTVSTTTIEICTNGIDDDGDGDIDFLDSDCNCNTLGAANFSPLSFTNFVVEIGNGRGLGDALRYTNVTTIGGTSVDIVARVIELNNFSNLNAHGLAGFFDDAFVSVPYGSVGVGTVYSAVIRYELYESGTNVPIFGDFEIEIDDLDLLPERRESITVDTADIDFYLLSDPTNIDVAIAGSELVFSGTDRQRADEAPGAVKFSYTNKSSFTIEFGAQQLQNISWRAGFYIDGNNFSALGICDEVCGNGIDDDDDGYADCFDDECPCYAPFECNVNSYYQTLRLFDDIPGEGVIDDVILYRINPTNASFIFVANLTNSGLPTNRFNGIAYNPNDRFIYGISDLDVLYRINTLGEIEELGTVPGINVDIPAGTMSSTGDYYLYGSGQLFEIDINTPSIISTTNVGGSYGLFDIAFNPLDGMLYGWERNSNQLMRIDPATGASNFIGSPDPQYGVMGSAYFNAQGDLIAYGDDLNVLASEQETLVRIDINTGAVTPLGMGPDTRSNDGCSCPYGIELLLASSKDTICNALDTLTLSFSIINLSNSVIFSVDFSQILPTGLLWASEPKNLTGLSISSTSISGSNNANFSIDNIQIGSSNSFEIDVMTSGAFSGGNVNIQATLNNLPPQFGTSITSDNPTSSSIEDPTPIVIDGGCVEICNNGIDDDGDGLTDLEDCDDCNPNSPILVGVPGDISLECSDLIPTGQGSVSASDPDPFAGMVNISYTESIVYHPRADWKNEAGCSIIHTISNISFDDKGTGSTADDTYGFTLAVIGRNEGSAWEATVNGVLISGQYEENELFRELPAPSGNIVSFDIVDQGNPACLSTAMIDITPFL